jgi:L-ascorbate metabolism protein UlaG (beta-lactamase superfamily)
VKTDRRRRLLRTLVVALVALVTISSLGPDVRAGGAPNAGTRAHHVGAGFQNPSAEYSYTLRERARYLFTGKALPKLGKGLAPLANDGRLLRNATTPSVTWIGHATLLVQMDGVNILTDPHFGQTASPVPFAGPRRIVPPGLRFEDLPPIHAVVISHDHWDHLDLPTVQRLAREHQPRFFVPLGLKTWLEARGIRNVVEMDWWEQHSFRGLTFVCTPVQHSSGRWLHDQNSRLWSSWVVQSPTRRMLFLGDTGYHPSLAEIQKLGPFDLVMMPVGGYSSFHRGHPNHVNPEEAIQLFEEVGGRLMVPMHWGTFDMNREPLDEPPARTLKEALKRGIEERIAILSPGQTIGW